MVPITLLDLIENNGYLKSLTDIYKLNGYDFYLVGGAVRDGILDIPTNDFGSSTYSLSLFLTSNTLLLSITIPPAAKSTFKFIFLVTPNFF